ncbi:hypothetical protein [Pseudoalteromonas luteoviolacea]|uniref:Uncharacterized protein n=1 Tax=Pseudoalteromonas luteoviolacea S4054 TaxID=1129367 RepID=A0A0F6ABU3_9GAMM|nr:hypothetical protein [Pseudoalteromonas luteoviolacea]AOT08816.1 hypothetical protein S4054249_13555 [Pseudoalteromonas luteoviolacea]AOT13729.1 hypothetical protein S40542_13525 [Pseudoalteromonas luteoviolacea]AOT18643.1 hypothetical protein S4054_13530 [Pseudoalteromonas luteoviolacea]KKE83623.1 hypothetical protein N479_13260 [Pseudoalteromonas luteoviolacea S4054]KZN72812.1 hypothetical protein N481_14395 [Pseudoalteromonas luteoviolacea S4047-1]
MQNSVLNKLQALAGQVGSEINNQFTVLRETAVGLPLFASFYPSKVQDVDEKHYFVIPYELGVHKVALHTIRSLPMGVPEVNTLPKRRVFHFANSHAEELLSHILSEQTESIVRAQKSDQQSRLEQLADDIDVLDTKLTYGMLVIGGLSALVNPAVGAAIAAKAALPSITGLVNKHGIRPLGEKLSEASVQKQIELALLNVQKEFSEGDVIKLVNPILARLETALRTNEQEYDPLIDEAFNGTDFSVIEKEQWKVLTVDALSHVYQDVIENQDLHEKACLGAEDIRWLSYLFKGYLNS